MESNKNELPLYATDRQIAERYHVSRASVWRWVEHGRIPPPKKLTPGCSRWVLADVIAALGG